MTSSRAAKRSVWQVREGVAIRGDLEGFPEDLSIE